MRLYNGMYQFTTNSELTFFNDFFLYMTDMDDDMNMHVNWIRNPYYPMNLAFDYWMLGRFILDDSSDHFEATTEGEVIRVKDAINHKAYDPITYNNIYALLYKAEMSSSRSFARLCDKLNVDSAIRKRIKQLDHPITFVIQDGEFSAQYSVGETMYPSAALHDFYSPKRMTTVVQEFEKPTIQTINTVDGKEIKIDTDKVDAVSFTAVVNANEK